MPIQLEDEVGNFFSRRHFRATQHQFELFSFASNSRIGVLARAFIAGAMVWLAGTGAANGEIQLPADAAPCVRWAASNLEMALETEHLHSHDAMVRVSIDNGGPELPKSISIEEQSFSLTIDGPTVVIRAGGAVGAMYGLQALSEQIGKRAAGARDWKAITARLVATRQRPFLMIRADNMFLHTSGTSEPMPPEGYPLLVNNLPMWRMYIDMLARDRYNLLDLHGAYDLQSTSFPNLYPMLVHVPEYPGVGNEFAQKRNLESLRAILAYAQSRGIRVALMNYSANNGRGGEFKNEPSVTGVPPDKLAGYTARAVALLIRKLPGLYMLGFRVGESTQPASFYKDAYLKGVEEANPPDLRLYTRSWQTTKEQLVPIAEAARNGFDIEIKFNGEHLGLPYQSMQGATYGSYSYQDYLDVPADYRILWQIRANGTHRFWAWENTEFIRRTVRACSLGSALGFTLEPHVAYFSVDPAQYYRSAADVAVYSYIWQKHWMWYYAWGRLGYDPDLAEDDIAQEFDRHFGAAGRKIYEAMQRSSRIAPLAYAYRFVGPDQRDFSPETETGDFDTKKKRARQDLLQFAENRPEDERSFAGIEEYVEERIAGKLDGRSGPFLVADRLESDAIAARALIGSVPAIRGHAADEWRLLRADLLAATYLGDYYAARIRGMTHLEFALHSGTAEDFRLGVTGLAQSRSAWKRLSETADAVYRPLSNPLRHQENFQWSSQIAPLEQLDATAETFWQRHSMQKPMLPLDSRVNDVEREQEIAGVHLKQASVDGQAIIQCELQRSSAIGVVLWWKPLPSELQWESVQMSRVPNSGAGERWESKVPFDARGLMYMVELHDKDGAVVNFPYEPQEMPWRMIPPFAPTAK